MALMEVSLTVLFEKKRSVVSTFHRNHMLKITVEAQSLDYDGNNEIYSVGSALSPFFSIPFRTVTSESSLKSIQYAPRG